MDFSLCFHNLFTCGPELRKRGSSFSKKYDFQMCMMFSTFSQCGERAFRRGGNILTALATVGNQGNPFLAARVQLELFSNYLHLTRVNQYLFSVVSGLFSHLVILSPIGECILNHFLSKVFVLGCEVAQCWHTSNKVAHKYTHK